MCCNFIFQFFTTQNIGENKSVFAENTSVFLRNNAIQKIFDKSGQNLKLLFSGPFVTFGPLKTLSLLAAPIHENVPIFPDPARHHRYFRQYSKLVPPL
jgi:catabolite regulation protein CreA